jgi:hypothetical protein
MSAETHRLRLAARTAAALQTVYVVHTHASTMSGRLFRLVRLELVRGLASATPAVRHT